jgi:hypothetical protein
LASTKKIRIVLDGNYNVAESDFSAFSLTIDKAEKGKAGVGADGDKSSSITFKNDAFIYIRTQLIDAEKGYLKALKVDIYETCCNQDLVFEGEIKGDLLEFCENDCEISVNPIEASTEAKLIDFLDSKTIADADYIKNTGHPHCPYCLEYRPLFLNYIVVIFGSILVITMTLLKPVFAILGLIVEAINAIPGINIKFAQNKNLVKEGWNLSKQIKQYLIRCSEKHPSILLKNWVKPALEENGFNFSSSIIDNLNSEFSEVSMIFADSKKGRKNAQKGLISGNEPLVTIKEYLEKLENLFNSEYFIKGDTVFFERKGFNKGGSKLNFDSSDLVDSGVCYEIGENETPAYRKTGFQVDGIDQIGNEAKDEYNDLIEWGQSDSNPNQKGIENKIVSVGMVRSMGDGIETNPFLSAVLKPIINTILGVSTNNLKNQLVLSSGIISENTPKVLHLDANLKVKNKNLLLKKDSMRQFHETDDPTLINSDFKVARFLIETLPVSCTNFALYADSIGKEIDLKYYSKKGIIDKISINYENRSFVLGGTV